MSLSPQRLILAIALTAPLIAQQQPGTSPVQSVTVDKRAFGVLPNYRAADGSVPFAPITTGQKYAIGLKDSFDKPVYVLSAFYASLGQLQNSNPELGQGMSGFGNRYVRSLADTAIGNLAAEAVLPSMLHEDPRYFLQGGTGKTKRQRLSYALTRVLITKTDRGTRRFNCSEWLGNAVSVGISNAYYPSGHTWGGNLSKLGLQVGVDAMSNVLKEFWPDIHRHFRH